jgi:hypothetical protein
MAWATQRTIWTPQPQKLLQKTLLFEFTINNL